MLSGLLRRFSRSVDPGQREEDELVCSRASGRFLFEPPTATSQTCVHDSEPSAVCVQPNTGFHSVEAEHLQATIRTIQKAGLLTITLNHLEYLEDIVRCSAVSKSWRVASQLARPTSIVIPGNNPKMDEAGMMTVLHWVQSKQLRQELKGVRHFATQMQAGLANDALISSMLPVFLLSMLMSTSSLMLTSCFLDGPFNFNQAASLLPTTIEHLTLCPETCGFENEEVQSMNIFARFTKLQYLKIDSGIPTGAMTEADTRLFCLTEPMPCLNSLYIASHIFSVRDHLPSTLLPNVEHLAVHVRHIRVCGYLALPRLKHLSLMMYEQHGFPVQDHLHLQIPSHLQCLRLTGPVACDTYITVQFSHPMNITCYNIDKVVCDTDKQPYKPFVSDLH